MNIEPVRKEFNKKFIILQIINKFMLFFKFRLYFNTFLADAFMKDRINKIITKNTKTPKELYEIPQTSAQEYGWYSKPVVKKDF